MLQQGPPRTAEKFGEKLLPLWRMLTKEGGQDSGWSQLSSPPPEEKFLDLSTICSNEILRRRPWAKQLIVSQVGGSSFNASFPTLTPLTNWAPRSTSWKSSTHMLVFILSANSHTKKRSLPQVQGWFQALVILHLDGNYPVPGLLWFCFPWGRVLRCLAFFWPAQVWTWPEHLHPFHHQPDPPRSVGARCALGELQIRMAIIYIFPKLLMHI